MTTDLFNVQGHQNAIGETVSVRFGEPVYMTISRDKKGRFVGYVYVGEQYRTPGVHPADDELPIYVIDVTGDRLFGRY